MKNHKTRHTAGVCMIKDDPDNPNLFLTGCYDGFIRVWDMRKLAPVLTSQVKVGEQCWDFVVRHQESATHVAAACIYDAAFFGKCSSAKWEPLATTKFTEHKTIVYGVDFVGKSGGAETVVATCSFYDKKLCIWKIA